ncbi:extracellular solute-binding protein [Paenibacillus sp. Soil787]|uniref:extracellular solute-binding protein n=1 Tax=Paenibacillus sp. Soil787 TaxID=1736411 RepID=UPI000702C893|nr:extracellular solute-binding protein [Paenibacillus sp. Soil787]KRF21676.1 ABC transporter substrate-binding protein [Paenibacillus sp. Soil787]
MKKSVSFIMTMLLAFGLVLTACSTPNVSNNSTPDAKNTPKASESSSGPVPIKIFAQQDTNTDLATNSFSKLAEEKFNVKFQWQTVPFDGAAEKRQISLASGDYPDLYMLIPWVDKFSQTDILRYSQQGVIIPLDDLINKYAPNVKAALDKFPYFKAMNTAPDGKIYGLTQLIECYHCSYPNKMWLNSSWLKKLNLQTPKTLDEYKQVLQAFKTKDPNGNGKADEVPLSGSIEDYGVHIIPYFMNGFIYDDDRTYLLLNNGKADIAANKAEWKQGLQFVKSMYDEGLIDKGAFTQNAAAFKKIGDNADAQILGAGAAMHPYIFVTGGSDNSKTYDAVPPLTGPNGAYAAYNYPSDPGATFVLTNKASKEAQIAAIKLVDYLFTQEGQIRGHFGEEGRDWRQPKDGDVPVEKSAASILATIPTPKGETPHNSSWGAMAQYFQPKAFRDGWIAATDLYDTSGYERRLQEATNLYNGKQPKEVFPHWAIWIDPSAADEAAMLKTNIKSYIDQNALQFVTGSKDLNKDWDAYVAGLNKLNLKRYLEIMQQSYDKSFKK